MRRHPKAPAVGSNLGTGSRRARFGGAFAMRDAFGDDAGSGAPSRGFLRRLSPGSLVASCIVFLAALLFPVGASATVTHFAEAFSPLTGAGSGLTIATPGGIAIDEATGNVFLDEGTSANRVGILGAAGAAPAGLLSPFTTSSLGMTFAAEPSGAAFDNTVSSAKGTLYATDTRNSTAANRKVKKFVRNPATEKYEFSGELSPIVPLPTTAVEAAGVAVDANGNVWVADRALKALIKFSPAGNELQRISTTADFTNGNPSGVAVDAAGDVFAQGGTSPRSLKKWTANGAGQIEPSTTSVPVPAPAPGVVTGNNEPSGVTVDPIANALYAIYPGVIVQYDATTLKEEGSFGAGLLVGARRAAINSATGRVYVSDNGTGKKNVAVFGPSITLPTVNTFSPSEVGTTKVTLNGSVNAQGNTVTLCKFEYLTHAAYTANGNSYAGPNVPQTKPCVGGIPADSNPHPVTAAIEALAPETTYHNRISVESTVGPQVSADRTFTTVAAVQTEPATAVADTTATLNGSINPVGAAITGCTFEYLTDTAYVTNGNSYSGPTAPATKPCAQSPGSIEADFQAHSVSAGLSSLQKNVTYHFRLAITKASGTIFGQDRSLTTLGPPQVTEEAVEEVTLTSAQLVAKLNPSGLSTTYRFEWGTSSSYGNRAPVDADLLAGSGASPIRVTATISGLQPDSPYHFRLVATNSSGTTKGPDRLFFMRDPLNEWGLPDDRGAEMVSPARKDPSGVVGTLGALDVTFYGRASRDGSSFAYPIMNGIEGSTSGGLLRQVAGRTDAGWQSAQLSPPSLIAPSEGGVIKPSQILAASPDLSCGLVETADPLTSDTPPVSGEQGIVNLYIWHRDGSYELVTNRLPLNPSAATPAIGLFYDQFDMADDCSHVFFRSAYKFLQGASGLYEWDEGELRDGGVRADGTALAGSSDADETVVGGETNLSLSSRWNAVTPAGSLFFTAVSDEGADSTKRAVFLRHGSGFASGSGDLTSSSTTVSNLTTASGAFAVGQTITGAGIPAGTRIVALGSGTGTLSKPAAATASGVSLKATEVVDVSQSRTAVPTNGARFEAASADGSRVFFRANYGIAATSSGGSTTGACASTGASIGTEPCDLYAYDVATGGLTDLSADSNLADTNGATVAGVVAVDEDGSHVYFAALGQLIPGKGKTYAENQQGNSSANIYLSHDGQLSYVTNLGQVSAESGDLLTASVNAPTDSALLRASRSWSAVASADGGKLLFTSASKSITGYDSGGPQEAYLYTAGPDYAGTITCVSCRSDGLPSLGSQAGLSPLSGGGEGLFRGKQTRPVVMSENGRRIFFNSKDVLAPGAASGAQNLYEWDDGNVYFLAIAKASAGGGLGTYFGAGASGDDVFIATSEKLAPQDIDSVSDVYDLRVGGGFPAAAVPPECDPAADECQGTATPQPPAGSAPASTEFQGAGNPRDETKRCRKGQVLRHGKCVRKAHKKGTQKKAGNASKNRAANSNRGGSK